MKKSKVIALFILGCSLGLPCEAVYSKADAKDVAKYISVHNHKYIPRPDRLGFQEVMIVPSYQEEPKKNVEVAIQKAIEQREQMEQEPVVYKKKQQQILETENIVSVEPAPQTADIYSSATLHDFSYTPEQLEQIRQSQVNIQSNNFINTVEPVIPETNVITEQVTEDFPVYHEVAYESMAVNYQPQNLPQDKIASYDLMPGITRYDDAVDAVRDVSPELQGNYAAAPSENTNFSDGEDFALRKTSEQHNGDAWNKIYQEEHDKENFTVNSPDKNKSSKTINESQRLRKEFDNLLKDKVAKKISPKPDTGDDFNIREDASLNESNLLNFPENTLHLIYKDNEIFNVTVAVNQTTNIRLKEYEKVLDITVGCQDGLTIEGYKDIDNKHSHIVIKPYEDGIKTMLRVTTNFSRYQFRLESGASENYNPYVLFQLNTVSDMPFNPQIGDRQSAATLKRTRHEKKPIEVQEPDELNFNFTIKAKKYEPKYVWDDGHYTYVLLPKTAYNHEIYILGFLGAKAQQIREYEIQDDFMKLYGTWSKLKFIINGQDVVIDNNEYIPE